MNYSKIIERIRPTKEEDKQLQKYAKEIIDKIKISDTKVILGGSGAKNTWVKGSTDVDIYVKFDYKKFADKSEKLSDIVYKNIKDKLKVSRLHGSRDYFQVEKNGFTFEIVPILDIRKPLEARNITDFSHLHVSYVKKYSKLSDQIRLAKVFTKSHGVYGAESYIRGFSGYVVELLVINYGSFDKLVKNAAKWKDITIIGNKKDAEKLNPSKKISPLILLDPVQPDRNAAAALSEEVYNKFIDLCKKFVKKSDESFFIKKEVDLEKLKEKKNIVFLNVEPLKDKKDISGAKMLKAFSFIKDKIEEYDFKIKESNWNFENKYFYLVFESLKLDSNYVYPGPPLKFEDGVKKFKAVNKDTFVKGNRVYAKKRREFTDAFVLLKNLIKEVNVKDRVKSIEIEK